MNSLAAAPPRPLKKLSVLMPVFNERATLRLIVDRVLQANVSLDLELVAVDDGSRDGSWELLQELSRHDARIVAVRQSRNQGKGAAVRAAIDRMTGDVAVVQDADLEYNPHDFARLLEPILAGRADAVFGSRFSGGARVSPRWHRLGNWLITAASNGINGLRLTDMETCYKMVRGDILKQLNLKSRSFTFEPELTTRLAQFGARIEEVPISYSHRTYAEGKKIGLWDAVKAIGELLRSRYFDRCCTRRGIGGQES